jgi:hypothetical protein
MRTKTRWWYGAAIILSGLFFAYLGMERRRPASAFGSEREYELEPGDDAVPAARGAEPLLPSSGVGAGTNWQVLASRSPNSGEVTIQVVTSSTDEIEDKEGSFRPTLILRCQGRELEVAVVAGRPAMELPGFPDQHAATIRFGKSPARDLRVRSRFEQRVLLLEPPADLIREMLQSDRLRFSFTSVAQSLVPQAIEMSFDLRGLSDVAPDLQESCPL